MCRRCWANATCSRRVLLWPVFFLASLGLSRVLYFGYSSFSYSQGCVGADLGGEWRYSINEAGRLLPQSLEHAALGQQYGVQRQAQRLGDLRSRLAFLNVLEERLPRHRGEVALHPLHQRRDDVLVVFAVPQPTQGAIM